MIITLDDSTVKSENDSSGRVEDYENGNFKDDKKTYKQGTGGGRWSGW